MLAVGPRITPPHLESDPLAIRRQRYEMAGRFGIGGAYIAQPREIFTLQNLLLRRRHLYGITGLSHAALRFYHTGRSKETQRDELHYCSEHLFQPLADSQPNEAANSRIIG